MGAPEHRFVATLHGEPGLWTAATGDRQPAAASYGIALLSRYPVRSWHVLQLPVLRRRAPGALAGRTLADAGAATSRAQPSSPSCSTPPATSPSSRRT